MNANERYPPTELMYKYYIENRLTIAETAKRFGLSAGKLYYLFRDEGYALSRKWKHRESPESSMRRSIARKGKKLSDEQKKRIGERNSCSYNGLNGYGHTKMHNGGYVLVYVPKHPNAHSDGYAMFHTVVMERKIGRYLSENEVVHHINHDKTDNRIENLMLMDKREHLSMHMKERHTKRRNATLTSCLSSGT